MARRSKRRKQKHASPLPSQKDEVLPETRYKSQMKVRLWMTINYLTIPLSSAMVFGFTALCEYLLFRIVWRFLSADIQENPSIASIANITQIAIAVITLVGAIVHSAFSLYGTIQIERQFAENDR